MSLAKSCLLIGNLGGRKKCLSKSLLQPNLSSPIKPDVYNNFGILPQHTSLMSQSGSSIDGDQETLMQLIYVRNLLKSYTQYKLNAFLFRAYSTVYLVNKF